MRLSTSERDEQIRFEEDMARIYADAQCDFCEKPRPCFKPCCFPPREWGELQLLLCHKCRVEYFPRSEPRVCPTCGQRVK